MATDEDFANDFIFKIVVIGDGATGKTSLIKRFTQGSFNKDYIKTLGAQFSRYERILEVRDLKIRARLFFWDIAGQNEFKFMRPTFYNGCKGVIIVWDLTRIETMHSLNEWLDDITNYCGKLPTICFGNKSDLIDEASYDMNTIREIGKQRDFLSIYLTSAKTGKNVHDAFNAIIDTLVKNALSEHSG